VELTKDGSKCNSYSRVLPRTSQGIPICGSHWSWHKLNPSHFARARRLKKLAKMEQKTARDTKKYEKMFEESYIVAREAVDYLEDFEEKEEEQTELMEETINRITERQDRQMKRTASFALGSQEWYERCVVFATLTFFKKIDCLSFLKLL
jgi:hypothetical protein